MSYFPPTIAQTSDFPIGIEVSHAEGIYLYDSTGKKYIDLISGIGVNNLGHRHPAIISAINQQLEKYLHTMVFGEFLQEPQIKLAKRLSELLPENLGCTFFVNSGSEAVEGAIKLAKRFTGRTEIIAFNKSYHGSTHGALSVMGNEEFKQNYRPLLPDVKFIEFNEEVALETISDSTACVIIEPIQGEGGVKVADKKYLKRLREICNKFRVLLIFDEVQCGMGRTGTLWAFEQFGVTPDILLLAKAFGGGLPLGAFISSQEIMSVLKNNPILGHITTFGGNPLSCVAGYAILETLNSSDILSVIPKKEKLFRKLLSHKNILEIRGKGLMLAVELGNADKAFSVIQKSMNAGLITDWFLHCPTALRISPPLTISEPEIELACSIINKVLDEC
ncbi:MAG: aminotransferase class III [Bacteroidetes bacterium RIFCSPLOWO2_02_FULL_36_8]|nr:MAG: aminotransferase class III [Bacteroidetes bacterium RIFCSPLOWO2_02_FULL_36_8]OFY71256.1 MAG: aminotransferase class III [Bacteroidetes bacterium RIFCSPLOWO2_12_FULL_37_12]